MFDIYGSGVRGLEVIHGGDIYRNQVKADFSVNINPLSVPEEVKTALHSAVAVCHEYPDIKAEKLAAAVGEMLSVPLEYLLFGNGASELFMAVVHALHPAKTVIPVPSFYGYEYAAGAVEGEILYYPMKEETGFSLGEDFFGVLEEGVELLFLANPNNPTGKLLDKEYLNRLFGHCRQKGIKVVLDECFIDFCGGDASMRSELEQYDNVMIVGAFTKIFAIPGVRLGYLLCSNRTLLARIRRQLPEWNLSAFAQAAGCVCAGQKAFVRQTAAYVRAERLFLTEQLECLGFRVIPGEADFILFYSEKPVYERLLERGILIRDCKNFRGLSEGYYRIAVKTREENEMLLKAMGECRCTR